MSDAVLDLTVARPRGLLAVDASAGTGKTYALVALAVRALADGEVTADGLLVVTFTRAAAAELRDRLRGGIRTALGGLVAADDPAERQPWVAALAAADPTRVGERTERLRTALVELERATITTLHGFCQTALVGLGLRAGGPPARLVADTRSLARDVVRDLLLARLVVDPDAGSGLALGDGGPDAVEAHLQQVVRELLAAAGSRPAPLGASDLPAADATAQLAATAVAELRRRLAAQGAAGFDDLVLGLHARLHGHDGAAVAALLRAQHRLVLVDEHQDTDAVQWEVLRRAFRDDLGPDAPAADMIVVGDPKQSIYRFRGADVDAYLGARAEADALRVLGESHRAAPELVTALNVLLAGATLGAGIEVAPVAAARAAGPAGPPALELRWLPAHRASWRGRNRGVLLEPVTRPRLLADVADRVVAVLASDVVPEGERRRRPEPQEVAVLVRNNRQAQRVVATLEAAGVPAAQPRGGSVYDSAAVGPLRVLLAALAAPDDERLVRALLASWFLRAPLTDLADERLLVATRTRLDGWRRELVERGLLPLWTRLRGEPDVAVALAAAGERGITDLEHLCELVHLALADRGATPAAALRALDELRLTRPLEDEAGDDPGVRRLDGDGAAVQVMTLHAAKGLEWPVVLLPFAAVNVTSSRPYAFGGPAGRLVDAASWAEWRPGAADGPDAPHGEPGRRRDAAKEEALGDEARLLYVGLTRARELLITWWVPTTTARGSRLHELLFATRGPDHAPVDPLDVPTLGDLDGEATGARLTALAGRITAAGGTAAVVAIPADPTGRRHVADAPALSAPGVARPSRRVGTIDVGRWSYTRLVAGAADRIVADDEPEAPGVEDHGDVAGAAPGPTDAEGGALAAVAAGGRWFGVLVHEALEAVDPSAPDVVDRLGSHLAGRIPSGSALEPAVLAAALGDVVATPLDPILPGLALRDVPAADRVAELRFDLTLADTDRHVDLAGLGAAVAAALGDDPLAPVLADLGRRLGRDRVAGWLTGSIDLVVRSVGADGAPRYVVIDHKTDVVRDAADRQRYDAPALAAHVAAGDYALQLLLYQVALHRLLRRRLDGYDPGRHLGGAALLFLRGLNGPTTPLRDGVRDGVAIWRPDPAVIVLADGLLAGGAA